jgi:adenylylsulfate kinase-like enzyme
MRQTQHTVIVVTGPIASGKSTVARALFHELAGLDVRAAVIDLDLIEDMLTADGPKADLESWALARRAAGRLANGFLKDGVAVVIADGSFNLANDRAVFEQHLDPRISPFYVTLKVTFDEALRRAQGDPTRGVSRDPAFLAAYFATAAKASDERPASDIVIDTESVSPTAVAAEIVRIVGQERRLPLG